MIPKLIHQIWFQDDTDVILFSDDININFKRIFSSKIPNIYKFNLIKLLIHNQDYTYCLWNEIKIKNLILMFYPKLLSFYLNLEYKIQKIDMAKYVILYHYGGFYLDIDIESFKSLNNFSYKDGLYFSKTAEFNSFENKVIKKFYDYRTNNYFINNGIMIASPKHSFFLDIFKEAKYNVKTNKDFLYNSKVFNTLGPSLLTNSIIKYADKYNNIYILDNKFFEPCYGKDLTCKISDDTILKHQHKSFWIENIETNNSIVNFLFHNFFSIFFDSLSSYYFLYLRGYKFLYFIIVFIIYDYNKKYV